MVFGILRKFVDDPANRQTVLRVDEENFSKTAEPVDLKFSQDLLFVMNEGIIFLIVISIFYTTLKGKFFHFTKDYFFGKTPFWRKQIKRTSFSIITDIYLL